MIKQHYLTDVQYELIIKSKSDDIESTAVTGFKIPIQAIFDRRVNLEVIQVFLGLF